MAELLAHHGTVHAETAGTLSNKTLIYKQIPTGLPVPGKDLAVEARPFDAEAPPPKGGLVLESLYASFDPYLRGKMRDPAVKSYSPAFLPEEPITSQMVGRVVKSDTPDLAVGDVVVAFAPIAQFVTLPAAAVATVRKIHNPHGIDLGHFTGALGMPGLTAYSSLLEIGHPKEGETIFISSAAGAVGQVVGQVAKEKGMKVIGSVGSDEKLEFITKELGFDAGFNYKKERPADALKRLATDGVDIYYENVGGEHLDAALNAMNLNGRIICCGMISQYNLAPEDRYPLRNIMLTVPKRLTIRGFLVGDKDFGPKYAREHQEAVQKWFADGSFKAKIDVTDGIDKAAEGLVGMLEGKNFGKAVLKIAGSGGSA